MRLGTLALTVVLAACQGGGIEIIVYPPSDSTVAKPDDIRLYVGFGFGSEDTQLGTSVFHFLSPGREGTLWTRDSDTPFDHATPAGDRPVHFTYTSRAEGDLLTVIAVGMTGGHATSAVAKYRITVPTDHVDVYRIGLNGVAPASPNETMSQLELWGANRDDETCVQLVETNGDISSITTPGDEDCDGHLQFDKTECDDHFYNGSTVPSTSGLTCLHDQPGANPTAAMCMFGGRRCRDGDPSSRIDCDVSTRYCTPTSLCGACADPEDEDKGFECALDPLDGKGMDATHWECSIPTTMDTTTGAKRVCPSAVAMQLKLPVTLEMGATCSNATFHPSDHNARWATSVQLGKATYDLSAVTTSPGLGTFCSIVFMANMVPTDLSRFPVGGMFAVDLDAQRGVAGQVVFRIQPPDLGCSSNGVQCVEVRGNVVTAGADVQLAACLDH